MTLSKTHLSDLRLIEKCPKTLRKQLLKKLPIRAVKTICECCHNLLKGNIPLTPKQKKELVKHKTVLRKIAAKKGALYVKKKLIVQRGGFLNILIPAAIGTLSALINGAR